MVKIIVGHQGRINKVLANISPEKFINAHPFGDGLIMLVLAGELPEYLSESEVKEVIKEVIKEVDNPELLLKLEEAESIAENRKEQIQTLQDALADALNAEELAKKEAEDIKQELTTLKGKFTKLKNKFLEED